MMNELALVNESLDWHYQQGTEWGVGSWYESGLTTSRRVVLLRNGATWGVTAHWVRPTGGQKRFSKFTQSGLSEGAARKLVRHALIEKWSNKV